MRGGVDRSARHIGSRVVAGRAAVGISVVLCSHGLFFADSAV